MPAPEVYVTRHLPGKALEYLATHCRVQVWDGDLPVPAAELRSKAQICDGLLVLLTDRVDEQLLAVAPRLRVVSNMATGFDNIDVAAATKRGVLVTRTPGVLSETTADFTFALLLAVARRVVEADRYVRDGHWQTWGPEMLLGHDLHGATIGIVGMGGIGQAVAKRAAGFGMRILYSSRTPRPDAEAQYGMNHISLADLLTASDFVTLHAPLTPETHHLIDEPALRSMKPSAILVNTARGALVNQAALYRALNQKWIAGAGLDVTDPEPISGDDTLLTLANLVITPHIASATVATRSRMAMMAAEQLVQALDGAIPANAVNPEAWQSKPDQTS
jgi:glyoxylate reductase